MLDGVTPAPSIPDLSFSTASAAGSRSRTARSRPPDQVYKLAALCCRRLIVDLPRNFRSTSAAPSGATSGRTVRPVGRRRSAWVRIRRRRVSDRGRPRVSAPGFIGCDCLVTVWRTSCASRADNIADFKLFPIYVSEVAETGHSRTSLALIDLNHPDPGRRRRHWKRRLRARRYHRRDGARAEARWRVSFRQRHGRLLRLDAGASFALARFRLARGAVVRLAASVER